MTPRTWLRLHDRASGDPCLVRADTVVYIWSQVLAVDAPPVATVEIDDGHARITANVLETVDRVEAMLLAVEHVFLPAKSAKRKKAAK